VYKNGAVSSAHELATEAGISILKLGGNAVDAAIATAFALSVVDPQNSGIGGLGGYATIYLKERKEVLVVNFGPQAPQNSSPDMFINSSNTVGHKAVSIPTVLKGLSTISEKYGKLPLSKCIEPSRLLAEDGFRINSALYRAINEDHLDSETKKVFQVGNVKEGDILKLPDYSKTLKKIQEQGEEVFYQGEIAESLLALIKKGKGILTKEDLINYEVKIETPGNITYHGYDIYFPLFNSGGITMAQILKIIENIELKELTELEQLDAMYHVMQVAFEDRFKVLEKRTVNQAEILHLINEEYCKKAAKKIKRGEYSTYFNKSEDIGHTTHLCTVDQEGNMVSLTQTNGQLWFGSGLTVPGTGIVLNCGMSQFSTDPLHPNAPQPSRSNLSNMTPTLALKNGRPFLAIGTPGSRRIITIVAAVIIQIIELNKTLKEALDAPRIHYEGSALWVEEGAWDLQLLKLMTDKYSLENLSLEHFYGSTTAIQVIEDSYYPEVDNRFPGSAGGY